MKNNTPELMLPLNKYTILILWLLTLAGNGYSQYTQVWAKTFDVNHWDETKKIIETSDRNIVVVGNTGEDESNHYGWVMMVNANGEKIWEKTFSENNCGFNSVIEASDGSIVLTGYVSVAQSGTDVLVVKLDNKGNLLWKNTYGGVNHDWGNAIIESKDKGYVIVGSSESNEEFNEDFWVVKIGENGEKVWNQVYGGSKEEKANAITQTPDGGFAIVGYTRSKGRRLCSAWLFKITSDGDEDWNIPLGVGIWDEACGVVNTKDGGLMICGHTRKEGRSTRNILLVKVNNIGDQEWARTYGTLDWEEATDIATTIEGNFAISAFSLSNQNDMSNIWLMTINDKGELLWENMYRKQSVDYAATICASIDGGIIAGGRTMLNNEKRGWDFALLKYKSNDAPRLKMIEPETYITSLPPEKPDTFRLRLEAFSKIPLRSIKISVNNVMQIDETVTGYDPEVYPIPVERTVQLSAGVNYINIEIENEVGISKIKRQIYHFSYPNWDIKKQKSTKKGKNLEDKIVLASKNKHPNIYSELILEDNKKKYGDKQIEYENTKQFDSKLEKWDKLAKQKISHNEHVKRFENNSKPANQNKSITSAGKATYRDISRKNTPKFTQTSNKKIELGTSKEIFTKLKKDKSVFIKQQNKNTQKLLKNFSKAKKEKLEASNFFNKKNIRLGQSRNNYANIQISYKTRKTTNSSSVKRNTQITNKDLPQRKNVKPAPKIRFTASKPIKYKSAFSSSNKSSTPRTQYSRSNSRSISYAHKTFKGKKSKSTTYSHKTFSTKKRKSSSGGTYRKKRSFVMEWNKLINRVVEERYSKNNPW